jgi:putative Mg2+ transporter-C (MgtC) family protein
VVTEVDVVWRLVLALVLASAIGIERELRQKSAGLRTYTLVGLGSALFMLISQYGFHSVLDQDHVILDPSRVTAQIVSGIGFIGAGLIFVRRDAVRGLTTAAGIWLVAAIGAAAGGDLPLLAVTTTAIYFLVAFAYPPLMARLPRSGRAPSALRVTYEDGRGILRRVLTACAGAGFAIEDIAIDHESRHDDQVAVRMEVHGKGAVSDLVATIDGIDGVRGVQAGDVNEVFD